MRALTAAVAVVTAVLLLPALACRTEEEAPVRHGALLLTATAEATATPTPTPEAVATPTPAPTATVPAGWATYVDSEFGFAVDYPADWVLLAPREVPGLQPTVRTVHILNYQAPTGYATPLPPGAVGVRITGAVNSTGLSLSSWVEESQAPGYCLREILSRADVTVNGLTGVKEIAVFAGGGSFSHCPIERTEPTSSYYFAQGDRLYVIRGGPVASPLSDTLDRIVQSFRLQ